MEERKTVTSGRGVSGFLAYVVAKSRQRDKWDTILRIVFISLQTVDLILTALAARYGWTELNPIMKSSMGSIYRLALLKFSIPAIISLFIPGRWLIPAIILLCGIIGWNVREIILLAL